MNKTVLLLPNILGFSIGRLFPMDNQWLDSLQQSALTPPDATFGIVWPILYLLIGYNLFSTKSQVARNILWLNLAINLLWIPTFYTKNLGASLGVLFLTWITSLMYLFFEPNNTLKMTIVPYVVWLTLALYLNWYLWNNN